MNTIAAATIYTARRVAFDSVRNASLDKGKEPPIANGGLPVAANNVECVANTVEKNVSVRGSSSLGIICRRVTIYEIWTSSGLTWKMGVGERPPQSRVAYLYPSHRERSHRERSKAHWDGRNHLLLP